MSRTALVSCVSFSIAAAVAAPAAWAETAEAATPTIRVSGEGTVRSQPDRAVIEVGVVTRGSSASRAATDNAREAKAVLSAVRSTIARRGTVETATYTLQPELSRPDGNAEPKLVGYSARNVLRVTLDDIGRTGEVIDTAIRAGADEIQRVQFTLRDEAAMRTRALRAAVADARSKANALADSLGARVTKVSSLVATEPTPRPMYEAHIARATAATPVLPAAVETTATVTLTVEIAGSH